MCRSPLCHGPWNGTVGLRSSRTDQKSDMWKPFFIFMLVV